MPVVVALICAVALLGLAAYQVALLRGAPWARFAWGGEDHYLQPQFRVGAIGATIGYLVGVLVVLQGANLFLVMPVLTAQIATYLLAGLFFLAFVWTARSRSPSERKVGLPVNLIMSALILIVAVTGHAK